MDKNTFKIFDYVKEIPKEDLHLSITVTVVPSKDSGKIYAKHGTDIQNVDPLYAIL